MIDEAVAAARFGRVRPDVVRAVLFALAYFIGGEVGYALSLGPSVGGTFWPPAGIALAVFLASPRHSWPQLLAAGLVANFVSDWLHGQSLPASAGFAAANLSEPILGAWLIGRLYGPVTFTRMTDILALALAVTFVSALFSSAVGAIAAELWTTDPPGFLVSWRTWWIGDAVGALVLTPCIFRVMTGWRKAAILPTRTWLELAVFGFVLTVVTQVVFSAPPASTAAPFLVFPVLLWGSLRFGPIGVGAALCLVVLLTSHDTAMGLGPFAEEHLSLGDRLIALQVYIGVMALSFHGLGMLWEERTRTAAALRLAMSGLKARHRRIVEQSPLAILVLEQGGAVREANPAWQKLWMRRSDPAGALRDNDRQWEEPRLKPLLERAFAGEIVELPERETVPEDAGSPRRVQGFAYPIKDERGEVAEVVLMERDITEELEAQRHREQLLEAERFARGEAERASQLKDEFLATLSHELRTPLNAIIGWAHILRRTKDEAARTQAVETIERNARAQARIIGDLLDMSRIIAGKVSLSLANVQLGDVVASAADALRPAAQAKGVSLSVDAGVRACVLGDAARLQQVVTNLLDNGIKFTPAGGSVNVHVEVGPTAAQVVVQDTGQGITPQFLPNVFERFRQADGSTTRRHAGLGLGLGIAKQIVDMHGGTLSAQSDGANRGAVFRVVLPSIPEDAVTEAAGAEDTPPGALADLRVLVVDDNADARELLRRLLTEHGCNVDTASCAEEARMRAAAHRYDLLLTDIGMPGTDGYTLLEQLRAEGRSATHAIAVTAFARPEDRERALCAGFDAHLAKPVSAGQLVHAIESVMSR